MNIGKRILAGVMLAALWGAAAVIVMTHSGCATVANMSPAQRNEAVDTVTRIATYTYIREAGDVEAQKRRAARIRAVVAGLQPAAAGEPLTLREFALLAIERLPQDLTPADKAIAAEFIKLLGDELAQSIGIGGLQAETQLRLTAALRAVDQAAAFFAPDS